jgi:hypothetical protein
VEFAYNATRAIGIEHNPFEANFGFSLREPPGMMFNIRPSIPVSQDATKRLELLQEIYALVRTVLQTTRMRCKLVHNRRQHRTYSFEETRCQSLQSISSFEDNLVVSCVIDHLDVYTFEEQIGKHGYILRLRATFRLHPVIHVDKLRLCSTTSLRPAVPITVPKGDNEEFDVSHISLVCSKSFR